MSTIVNFSQVSILSNIPTTGNEEYGFELFNDNDVASSFFYRNATISGKNLMVAVGINNNGGIDDSDIDYATLPCPPYCNNANSNITSQIGNSNLPILFAIPNNDPNSTPTGFDEQLVQQLRNQIGTAGLLELEVKVKGKKKKRKALIGINQFGRVMDAGFHKVLIK